MKRYEADVKRLGPLRWQWSVIERQDGEIAMEMTGQCFTAKQAYLMGWRIKEHREIRALVEEHS